MRARAVVLAVAIVLAPLGARAADLVVWWEKGFYPQEDAAVREIIAAFEQKTGKQVELVSTRTGRDLDEAASGDRGRAAARLRFRRPHRRLHRANGLSRIGSSTSTDAIGPVLDLFDPDALAGSTWLDGKTGQTRPLRAADGPVINHVHVWKSLLERAGFTLADIPKRVGGVLVVLVRPGAARGAQGDRAATTSGASGCHMSGAASDTDVSSFSSWLAYGRRLRRPATAGS